MTSSRRVEAVVFDLGGVIVAHDNAVMHRRIASRCLGAWSPEAVAAATADGRWGTGRPIPELHAELVREAGYAGDWDSFAADFCCHLVVDVSMLAFVERLAARRRVMIFSNTNVVHWTHVVEASHGRLGLFERYLSYEMGCAKPSLRSFRMVADAAGLTLESLLFFDDIPANVAGARAAGLQAAVFESEAALQRLLTERGVLP